MSGVVLDTSVVMKQLVDGEHSEQAWKLFNFNARRESLFAPTLLRSEVTNALFQRTRRRENSITLDQAQRALALFIELPIRFIESTDLYGRAAAFAHEHQLRATYDSLYVVLAESLEADLWTADRAFLNNLRGAAPWVRWIGDYPI